MKKLYLLVLTALLCGCAGVRHDVSGVVADAAMNTITIFSLSGDTLSFKTTDADKRRLDGLLLGDTVTVRYSGKYSPYMPAVSVANYHNAP